MPAAAADASAWSQDTKSAVRLIAGDNKDDAALRSGIEVRLQPGWHTYWRYPGDSGVPPRFDFSGSDNVKSATVRFPAPRLFTDDSGKSVGYADNVIFPVRVVPRQPAKSVTLRLKIDYAACEKLCIPAEGRAELTLVPGANSSNDAALTAAEARVPVQASAAEIGLTARRVDGATKPLVAVDLKIPSTKPVVLLAEGPSPEWALPIPRPAQGASGRQHFSFELDGLPPGVSPKAPVELTFTVVEDGRAVEVKTRLD